MKQNKSHLNCIIDTELRQEIKKIAAEKNCSITNIVESLLKEYIENYLQENQLTK